MPFDDLDRTLSEKTRLAKRIAANLRKEQEAEWRTLAGPWYEKMLEDRGVAEELLRHCDRNVRLAALGVISFVWRPNAEDPCVTVLEILAVEDPDAEVRSVALCALGACYRGTSEPRLKRLLADLVADEAQPTTARRCAYQALCAIDGRQMPSWPGLFADPPSMLRIPDDVDWAFVNAARGK